MDEEIKILCVDDEKNVLKALRRLFMDHDYEILTAESGQEGLEILKEQRDIQLIVSDYRMPEMDGVEFLKRACECSPETIRIVLSGYADTASVVAAINEGRIYKFIPKPWNDDELKVTIEKAIEVFFLKRKNEHLAEKLMAINMELTEFNSKLENEVRIRTADLEFQNRAMKFAHNVIYALPAAVIGLDPNGLIVLSNNLSDKLFGTENRSLVGISGDQIFPPELNALFRQAKENKQINCPIDISHKFYRLKGTKMLSDEEQEGVIFVFFPDEYCMLRK